MIDFEHSWPTTTEEEERNLAVRIAQIVGFSPSCPPFKKENGTWVLNGSNNWFLHLTEPGKGNLTFRYVKTPEQWAALKVVIEMAVNKF